MRKKIAALAMLALICLGAKAQDELPTVFSDRPDERFRVSTHVRYGSPVNAMKLVVAGKGKNTRRNTFFVVGYKWRPNTERARETRQVWVLWKEEQTLMLWDGGIYQDTRDEGLAASRRSLTLGKDTVPTPDDIRGSTYLVSEGWWHGIANDCRKHGEKYVIQPFKAPKRDANNAP